MKKNLMFFVLGVSTALLMGAGISYWNEIRHENKYGVLVDSLGSSDTWNNNYIPNGNKYALVLEGEIGDNVKKAMVVGFIHGMAVGREKAAEEARAKEEARNPNYRNQQNYPNFIRRY